MSDRTKSYRKKYIICKILSLCLLFLPLVIFIGTSFVRGTVTQKTTLGIGVTLCLIFTIANAMFKWAPRSAIWILIIALTIAINKIQHVIYIVGIGVIIEECITSKLEKYYHDRYVINNQIDDRIGDKDGKEPDSSEA